MLVLSLSGWSKFDENQCSLGGHVQGRRILAVTLILLSWCAWAGAKDLAVISNKSNSVQTVTLAELTKICKGQVEHWPDGKAVSFITRDPTLPDMKLLLQKVYGMSKEEVKELIANANHGRTNHPAIVVVESDEDAVQKAESIPGAVGVVDVYSISGAVTVLKVGGKLPLEPGYPLHGN
jgi:ABC-type phosphate transport system substrate-binding protein